jgi:hypothetical protein
MYLVNNGLIGCGMLSQAGVPAVGRSMILELEITLYCEIRKLKNGFFLM